MFGPRGSFRRNWQRQHFAKVQEWHGLLVERFFSSLCAVWYLHGFAAAERNKLKMTKKRRNAGRSKHGRGHTRRVWCYQCNNLVAKDKATSRFLVRNLVDASTKRDIEDNSAIKGYEIPKLYVKTEYCVSCAIHSHIVHVRSVEERRVREAPQRFRPRPQQKTGGAQ
eukprot:TRINITY_DN208_c0_g1_i1.p2 TRINITY_DN208_c0_g1~~TRINITY_DN208_c0_g1_i1.p2  ORF type:complete len:167 (-),score=27.62 TRINITY_DN208_c0_g1_i1:148-648(-)